MTNEVTAPEQTNLALHDEDDPFLAHAQEAGQRSIIGTMLKFSKGDWYAGQDNDEVPEGTRFVANMFELLHGWVKWEDNKPTEHIMGKVFKRYKPPARKTLGDDDKDAWEMDNNGKPRDPWQDTYYLLLKGTGNAEEELFTFPTASKGGRDAVLQLCNDYGTKRRTIQNPDEMLPIVEIGVDSYMHPKRELGRIKTPEFKIVGWASKDLFADVAVEDHDPETGEVLEPKATDKVDAAVAAQAGKPANEKTKPRF